MSNGLPARFTHKEKDGPFWLQGNNAFRQKKESDRLKCVQSRQSKGQVRGHRICSLYIFPHTHINCDAEKNAFWSIDFAWEIIYLISIAN